MHLLAHEAMKVGEGGLLHRDYDEKVESKQIPGGIVACMAGRSELIEVNGRWNLPVTMAPAPTQTETQSPGGYDEIQIGGITVGL